MPRHQDLRWLAWWAREGGTPAPRHACCCRPPARHGETLRWGSSNVPMRASCRHAAVDPARKYPPKVATSRRWGRGATPCAYGSHPQRKSCRPRARPARGGCEPEAGEKRHASKSGTATRSLGSREPGSASPAGQLTEGARWTGGGWRRERERGVVCCDGASCVGCHRHTSAAAAAREEAVGSLGNRRLGAPEPPAGSARGIT